MATHDNPYLVSRLEVSWDDVAAGRFPKTCTPTDAVQPPARAAFRQALAEVAARAKEALPKHVSRIDKAVQIVLADDIVPGEGGKYTVGSASDAGLHYVVDGECECKDADREEVQGWCKHHLAVALWKRTRAALGAQQEAATVDQSFEEVVDEGKTSRPEPPPAPQGPALPEAPYSASFKAVSHGFEVQITVHKSDNAEFLAVLTTMPQWLEQHGYQPTRCAPKAEATAAREPTPAPVPPSCPQHGAEKVKRSTLFAGWFCTGKLPGDKYCKWNLKD